MAKVTRGPGRETAYAADHRTAGDGSGPQPRTLVCESETAKARRRRVNPGESVRVKYKTTQKQYKPMSEKQSEELARPVSPSPRWGGLSRDPYAWAGEGLFYK